MAYNILTIRDAVAYQLQQANTTTATYPSGGLSAGITATGILTDGNIIKGRPSKTSNTMDRFPLVWVSLDEDSESIAQMGQGAQRQFEGKIAITAACKAPPTADYAHTEAEDAMATLCGNIRTALRNAINLMNTTTATVSYSVPETVEYNVSIEGMGEGTYVSAGKISLKFETFST